MRNVIFRSILRHIESEIRVKSFSLTSNLLLLQRMIEAGIVCQENVTFPPTC